MRGRVLRMPSIGLLFALLLALVPVCATSTQAGGMQQVSFESPATGDGPGPMLRGELYLPDGAGQHGAVVLLSGCYGVEDLHRQWARLFQEAGYAALVVDSLTPRAVKEVCTDPWKVGVLDRAGDAYAAKQFLASRADINARRIVLAGWSHGGWSLLHAIYPRQKRVDDLIKAYGAFSGAIAFYPYCDVAEAFEIPLLVVIGDKDDWTPKSLCDTTVEKSNRWGATPPVDYVVYKGATHSFDDPFGADEAAIKAWIATEPAGTARLAPGGGFLYLGHHIKYDAAAHADTKSRVLRFLDAALAP